MNLSKVTKMSLLAVGAVLAGCANTTNQTNSSSAPVKIGILQYVEHEALTQTKEGFIAGLAEAGFVDGKNIVIDFENAHADQSNLQTISEKMTRQNALNMAIATPAAQAMQNASDSVPLLFSAVTDPVGAGLVKSMENPGGNITGTSDMAPIDKQIELLLQVKPDVKKVGILYTATERNSEIQSNEAKKLFEQRGIEVVVKTIASTNEMQDVAITLADQSDAIFIPLDNNIASAISVLAQVGIEKKVPIIGGSKSEVEAGALLTYGTDYTALGKQTAKLAVKILNGEKPANVAAEYTDGVDVIVNEATLKHLALMYQT